MSKEEENDTERDEAVEEFTLPGGEIMHGRINVPSLKFVRVSGVKGKVYKARLGQLTRSKKKVQRVRT